ncbi:hypothetical protein FHS18_005359 [Paenibacillus phyllosphaerae]|uniref:Uncharacterized protein n=1 Tax=Paenibacillus phyllosphaerae TaxID=274593 RepID=A0A7W5B3W1_9BACL|nr:hypothetical protein [Paenibacillus phyllosphaerae]MBB3113256.1 hypothetical protein [Paenibacillus phyllosphaerae]
MAKREYSILAAAIASFLSSLLNALIVGVALLEGGAFIVFIISWGVTLGYGLGVSYLIHRWIEPDTAAAVVVRYILHVLAALLLVTLFVLVLQFEFHIALFVLYLPAAVNATLYYWIYTFISSYRREYGGRKS